MGTSFEQLEFDEPLVMEANPFGGAEARWVASPVQTALAELVRQIDGRRRLIVVAGKAGTGKTLLMDMVVRVCADKGLSTRRIDRGDLVDVAHYSPCDVVLVDEAGSITEPTAQTFLSPDGKTATTCVFLCLPTAVHRFCCADTYVVDLHGLSRSDARTYLLERAKSIGHPRLFAPDALDLILDRARGAFRLLRSIASLAFFDAAHEGAKQVAVTHVAHALESQMAETVDETDTALRSRIPHGNRADEAVHSQVERVIDALERQVAHVDEESNRHADVSYSDSADESGTDAPQGLPIDAALESPTLHVDEERKDLESAVLGDKSGCPDEINQTSQPELNWHRLNLSVLRKGNESVEYPWRRTATRRAIGLAIEPIPDIGAGPYRLSAHMRKTSASPVSPVKTVGKELRDEREHQRKQLDDVLSVLKIRPNYLAAIEEGRFEDLPDRAFPTGYVGPDEGYLQLEVENHLERPGEEITAPGIVNRPIEQFSDRKFPIVGIAIASLLFAALIYLGNDIVSFAKRTFEQVTEEDFAQELVSALVPSPTQQQIRVEAPKSIIVPPREVETAEPVSLPVELLPPMPVMAVAQRFSVPGELLPPIPVIAVTRPASLRADLLPPIPVVSVTQPASPRVEPLPPIPVIAVTRPASLRAELLPPIPVIAVAQPVSLPTELLPQRVQARVPSGRRYGIQNRDSRITLKVHRPTIVAIRDARNRIFIDRKLAAGDTYRVPNLVGLWLTAIDASAVEIILDGESVGFAGAQTAEVRDLSLNPQSIAERARPGSAPTFQAVRDQARQTSSRASR